MYKDDFLWPFVEEAKKRIPYFAAALIAISVGAYEAADRMMALAGGIVKLRSDSGVEQQISSDKDSGDSDGSDG